MDEYHAGICKICITAFQIKDYVHNENARYCNICDCALNPIAMLPMHALREDIMKAIQHDEEILNKEKLNQAKLFIINSTNETLADAFIAGAEWMQKRKPHYKGNNDDEEN